MLYLKIFGDRNVPVLKEVEGRTEIVEVCSGLDLFKTAWCLNKNVKTFYSYNISNIGKVLTFDQLKVEGGVCEHYSALYQYLAEQLGYEGETIDFFPSDLEIGHTFFIMYNKEGYCVLDQNAKPFCLNNLDESPETSA